MKKTNQITAVLILLISASLLSASTSNKSNYTPHSKASKIQVAILLDVSNSMDGLIEQAKAQLWNMVSVMGRARCNDVAPDIEIALYEYGRSSNDSKAGYVKQISGFSNDLNGLSKKLFGLTTNGGDEYCGHVIYTALKNLNWGESIADYKVIFIAGNEDFLQGSILYTKACEEAKKKGVIVNTIYCGEKSQGIKEHWNLGSECGNGSFTNINPDARIEDIPTPYDSVLFTLNKALNATYISYGYQGATAFAEQNEVDEMNFKMNQSVAAKRVAVKGKKELYKNYNWDLVDAVEKDSTFLVRVDMKTLPPELKNKNRADLQKAVKQKSSERTNIQKKIQDVTEKRENFLVKERMKRSAPASATLETEIEKIIKQQAKRFNMIIK